MFTPNSIGSIRRPAGRDVHSRVTFSAATPCPYAPVNMLVGAQKTSVRADSSASRGSADETVAQRAKILVPSFVIPVIGDRFEAKDGMQFQVAAVHPRAGVDGIVDHYECDLEVVPNGG